MNQSLRAAADNADVEGVLCWCADQRPPLEESVLRAWRRPGDVWHAGLRLGMGGLPASIDFVHPTWTLNRDPDAHLEATSWRVSLRACLLRCDVIRKLGALDERFASLDAAALDFGHRCLTAGAFTRHLPWLVDDNARAPSPYIAADDAFLFILNRFGAKWTRWALLRASLTGELSPVAAVRLYRRLRGIRSQAQPGALHVPENSAHLRRPDDARVSVIVPTVDRYPYLRVLLKQLRTQSVPPHEIIVVDQTAEDRREPGMYEEFGDLPLTVHFQDRPGQCSSRNWAIRESTGDFLLFLDDDDEVEDSLIARHLTSIERWSADVSSGVADEVGAGPLPENFRQIRLSDVFPTNNSMLRREVLRTSGLFDLAYERGQRADGDLGTRIYLTGAVMVLNPTISVLHHHAPSGGLRKHKARVQTYAASRQSLWVRQLPSATEFYLGARYFTPRQRRESGWIRVLGTFSVRGSIGRKAAKAFISAVNLPGTLRAFRKRRDEASAMCQRFPDIPTLPELQETLELGA
ncbi:MAG: glycosyltransferase [Planctomycetia bacterium]|nr:glycosyltransferase [Planctomycetia bacterium]